MFALYHRDVHGGEGQRIDISLFESLFSVLGPGAAEYANLGKVRTRQGNRSANSSPRGCYRTSDGRWIAVSASTPKMAERFLESYGLGALLEDPRFATNESRVKHAAEMDDAVQNVVGKRTLVENVRIIEDNKLTAHPVQTIADIESDEHWRARRLTVDIGPKGQTVRMHDVVPRLSETPGEIRWPGGRLGEHTEEFYREDLNIPAVELERLRARGWPARRRIKEIRTPMEP